MDFEEDPVYNVFLSPHGMKRSIEIMLENECYVAALILVFSAIDTMGNLVRPESRSENSGEDFMNWVRRYVALPNVTPRDLWSARNALLHTYGCESRDTKRGSAKTVFWAFEGRPTVYDPVKHPGYIIVDIKALANQTLSGMQRFVVDVFASSEMRPLMEARLPKLLVQMPCSREDK